MFPEEVEQFWKMVWGNWEPLAVLHHLCGRTRGRLWDEVSLESRWLAAVCIVQWHTAGLRAPSGHCALVCGMVPEAVAAHMGTAAVP